RRALHAHRSADARRGRHRSRRLIEWHGRRTGASSSSITRTTANPHGLQSAVRSDFMFKRLLLHAVILTVVVFAPVALDIGPRVTAQVPAAGDPPQYVLPPKPIVEAFDAEPLPQTLLSPNKQVVALTK